MTLRSFALLTLSACCCLSVHAQVASPANSTGSPRGILHPEVFPGGDLSQRVAAALGSLGGTARQPVSRAVIELRPGETMNTAPITLPNATTAPYVLAVDFRCNGSTLVPRDNSAPLIRVLPQNNNGGAASGSIHGCNLVVPSNAPAIEQDSRQALDIYDNVFVGGSTQLLILNTAFQDGSPGFNEQYRVRQNDFLNPRVSAIELGRRGGSDSAEYGDIAHTNHFQLPCGAAAVQVDAGVTVMGGELSGKINTSSSPCRNGAPALAIRTNGGIYRGTTAFWTGENTGNIALFFLGGAGGATLDMHTVNITGMGYKQSVSAPYRLTMPYSVLTTLFGSENCTQMNDESNGGGSVFQRKGILAVCQNRVRLWKGAETDDAASLDVYHYNNGSQPDDATSLTSTFRSIPGMGTAFGPGFTQISPDGTCSDAAGCIPRATPAWLPAAASASGVNGYAMMSADATSNKTQLRLGYKRPGDTHPFVEVWALGEDLNARGAKDFFLYNDSTGHAAFRIDADDTPHFSKGWSGTCAAGHALIVTDGVVTGCK